MASVAVKALAAAEERVTEAALEAEEAKLDVALDAEKSELDTESDLAIVGRGWDMMSSGKRFGGDG